MATVGRSVDQVVGTLSRFLHMRRTRKNTVDEIAPYLDAPPSVLFPPPAPHREFSRTAVRTLGSRDRTVEALEWRSEHTPLSPSYRLRQATEYAPNETVTARWTHPRSGPRRKALVYVHGWLEPGPWIEHLVLLPRLYEELGVDVLHLHLPFHGRRNPKGSLFHGELFWTADLVRSFEAVRQSCIDARSLVGWLRERGYTEIGVTGISMGGSIAMVLACLSPVTPDYIVPMVSHLALGEAVEEAPIFWRMRHDLEAMGIDAARRQDIFRRLGLEALRPVLPPERQLWLMAKEDLYITPAAVERQRLAWGRPRIEWLAGGHMTFALSMGRVLAAIRDFHASLPTAETSRPTQSYGS